MKKDRPAKQFAWFDNGSNYAFERFSPTSEKRRLTCFNKATGASTGGIWQHKRHFTWRHPTMPRNGTIFAELPDDISDPLEPGRMIPNSVKQDKLLELCRCSHGYLMKYLVMIRHGHVPVFGANINKDIKTFIQYFLPRGAALSRVTVSKAVRHLHLAFKGKETTEIYDILMEQLLRAIQKIRSGLYRQSKMSGGGSQSLSLTTIWSLIVIAVCACSAAPGSLQPVFGEAKERRIEGWRRTRAWPPPQFFFGIIRLGRDVEGPLRCRFLE